MYFPFIRGKTYDLLALRELLNNIPNSTSYYLPVVEPVKDDLANLKKLFDEYNKKNQKIILLINPSVGDFIYNTMQEVKQVLLDNKFIFNNIIFAYQINANTKVSELNNFISLFSNSTKDNLFVFVHTEANSNFNSIKTVLGSNRVVYNILDEDGTDRMYRSDVKSLDVPAVVIKDNFKVRKNAEYPPEEFFSDLYAIHITEGYLGGFGDYLTIGKKYSDTGGAAYAVAIHLTYFSDRNVLNVKHFKSKTNNSPVNVAGKFYEALQEMDKHIKPEDLSFHTKACDEFKQLYKSKTYKGLGYIKKLSIKHHIELIVNKIKSEKKPK